MTQSKKSGGTLGNQDVPIGIPAPKLEGIPEAARPFVEMSMKLQAQILELYGHRCCAWLDWPDKSCTCKTMEDFTKVHSDYLTNMQRDYAQFMDRVLRETLVEQKEFEEEAQDQAHPLKTGTHREAA